MNYFKSLGKFFLNNLGYIYCHLKGVKLGRNVQFLGIPFIKNKGELFIGDNVIIHSHWKSYHALMSSKTKIIVEKDAKIVIGRQSRINGACLHAKKKIIIGENTFIAANTSIIDVNGHKTFYKERHMEDLPKEIIVGNNVWIGLNCILLKGTIIRENSVIAAGAIISGEIPLNTLVKSGSHTLTFQDIHDK